MARFNLEALASDARKQLTEHKLESKMSIIGVGTAENSLERLPK